MAYGQLVFEEVRDDPLHVGIVADHFRRPAARDEHADVPLRIDLGEGEIRLEPAARRSTYVSQPGSKSWTTS